MQLEGSRSLPCAYRRVEGLDLRDGCQSGSASPGLSTTSVKSEMESFSPTTPTERQWYTGYDGLSGENTKKGPHEGVDGLKPDGTLRIECQTYADLLQSYTDNIHILHPFLDLDAISLFISPSNPVPNQAHHKPTTVLIKGVKRKHSTSTASGPPIETTSECSSLSNRLSRPFPDRSISTALALLMMALGSICQWKGPLPGMALGRTQPSHQRTQQFPTSTQTSDYWNVPSAPNGDIQLGRISGVQSRDRLSPSEKGPKNLDVIPGLAYYAYAVNILGDLQGTFDLTYVQAKLLAGLYAAQLAHVMESWNWIASACTDFQVLLLTCVPVFLFTGSHSNDFLQGKA